MTAQLSPLGVQKFYDNNGNPLSQGLLYTYAAGTNNPQATYVDSTQTTQNTNPIQLNFRGECNLWLDPTLTYKLLLTDSAGNTIPNWPVDNVPGGFNLNAQSIGAAIWPRTPAEINASVTPSKFSYPPYNVLRYGADATGGTASTNAFITAGSLGELIYVPAGTYKVASGITITGGGIVGDGAYESYIIATDSTTTDVFTYTGALAGRFENFQIEMSGAKTNSYGITIGPASGEVSGMRLFQVVVNGLPSCINFKRASLWSMVACNFYGYTGDAILVDNQNNADSGDSVIADCQFTSPGNTSAHSIRQVASGGLKVIGNKFNNAGVHVLLDLGANSTSDLIIVGNSFENAHFSAIQLQRTAGSAVFQNVVIVGNQFLVASSSNNSAGVFTNNGAAFLNGLTISGNLFRVNDTGATDAVVVDYVTNVLVDSNTMIGNGGTSVGVLYGTHNTGVKVGINTIRGFTNSINVPATTNVVASDFQTGTTNVTTSTALGSLFSGTVTIAFPTAFCTDFVPTLQNCSATVTSTTGGGIAAQVTAVNASQLFITVVGITNGGSVPIQWSAGGIL